MVTATRLLSIHPGMVAVIRSAIQWGEGVTVDYGVKGTTIERPWGVVADRKGRGE